MKLQIFCAIPVTATITLHRALRGGRGRDTLVRPAVELQVDSWCPRKLGEAVLKWNVHPRVLLLLRLPEYSHQKLPFMFLQSCSIVDGLHHQVFIRLLISCIPPRYAARARCATMIRCPHIQVVKETWGNGEPMRLGAFVVALGDTKTSATAE